jgi:hypothetical protein
MYYIIQNIKQNLPHVLDLALPQEEEIRFLEQSRIKFRQDLESSILNRVEAIEKIVLHEEKQLRKIHKRGGVER